MRFLRYSSASGPAGSDERIEDLEAELSEDLIGDKASVFRIDTDAEVERVATLYAANRLYAKEFTYFEISPELVQKHGGRCEPCDDEEGSPFGYMRTRHYEIRGIMEVRAFINELGRQQRLLIKRPRIKELRFKEQAALEYTAADEWTRAEPWAK